ncbi:MAG: glyoxalase/bleomycin resistance protein/dioxygenase [Chloroflexi bacterium]|nr:glyoxalase/bleomycin resistance protein/dioxygenase [Chloroflexota bacterium]
MPLVETSSLVHFSIPVNDLEESLKFYTDVLGMTFRGKVGPNGRCVMCGETPIILVERPQPRPFDETMEHNGQLCHQAFHVSSEDYDRAQASFEANGVKVLGEEWRKSGTFNGRSFYFFDPSGNRLEINDPTPPFWPEGVE